MKLYKPFIGSFPVTQPFGGNPSYYSQFGQRGHNGIDYGLPSGTPVRAAADGVIEFEGWGQKLSLAGAPAGIYVMIEHSEGWTGYAHLNRTIVDKGQKVTKGQIVGYSGASGTVTGAHLHFERFPNNYNLKNGYYGRINPQPELNVVVKPPTPTDPCLEYKKQLEQCKGQLEAEKRLTSGLMASNKELADENDGLTDEIVELREDLYDNELENKQLLEELEACEAGQPEQPCMSFWDWVKCKTSKK